MALVETPNLNDDLALDAWIGPDTEDAHRLELSLGLCMSIDDALLTALSIWGFYTDREQKNDKPEPFAIVNRGADLAGRYHDYAEVADASPAALADILTLCTPLDAMKLAQSDLLLSFALRWIVLHEQAHLLLGHLDWWAARHGKRALGLAESRMFAAGSDKEGSATSYCLELQADAFATQMILTLGLSEAMQTSPAVARYGRARQAALAERRAYAPDLGDRLNMFRSLLLAACASSLVFEVRREKRDGVSGSHPPPSTRILNICTTALATLGDILQFERGGRSADASEDAYPTDLLRPAINAVMTCMVEFEMMAGVIGVESSIYKSALLQAKDEVLRPSLASPLADDFFSLMYTGRREAGELKTEGARAFVSLLDRSKALQRELAPYARIGAFQSD